MAKTRVVNRRPLARLSGRVAQPRAIAGMGWKERGQRTCGVCDITYLAPADASSCEDWHYGKGS